MPPPELMDDAFGEILLRIPPDDPAHLLRASLVCKRWRRLLTDPAFLHRYRAFHQTPPLLGFLRNTDDYVARFVPMGSFRPRDLARRGFTVLDCRHGRVLLEDDTTGDLVVWDPVTGEDQHVDKDMACSHPFNATVLCAAADCDHLDCHGGPFLVVLVAHCDEQDEVPQVQGGGFTGAWVYSSEAGEWSSPATVEGDYFVNAIPPVLAGGKVYFFCEFGHAILCFDLRGGRGLSSLIDGGCRSGRLEMYKAVFLQAEHGALFPRFAILNGYKLSLWSLETVDPGGAAVWSQLGVIQLDKLLLVVGHSTSSWNLIGFTKTPNCDIVFMSTYAGVFTVELDSHKIHKIRKVYEEDCGTCHIFPYRSFFTPDCAVGRLG